MAPGHRYSFWNDRQVSDSKMLGVMLVLSTGIQRGWWQACLELVWYIYLPRPFLQIGSQPVNLAGLELNRVYQTDLEPFRPISWQNLYNKKLSFTPSRPAIIVIPPPFPFLPLFPFLFSLSSPLPFSLYLWSAGMKNYHTWPIVIFLITKLWSLWPQLICLLLELLPE